jgi:hypothetical protein
MPTKEELFAAIMLIKEHCREHDVQYCCNECPIRNCAKYFSSAPCIWPDPEEGGGEE